MLPALLEQSHMRNWIKNVVKFWAICVSKILGLRSFLLGDEETQSNSQTEAPAAAAVVVQQNPFQFNIGVAHQALLQNNGTTLNQPYTKPTHFKLRVISLFKINNILLFLFFFFF